MSSSSSSDSSARGFNSPSEFQGPGPRTPLFGEGVNLSSALASGFSTRPAPACLFSALPALFSALPHFVENISLLAGLSSFLSCRVSFPLPVWRGKFASVAQGPGGLLLFPVFRDFWATRWRRTCLAGVLRTSLRAFVAPSLRAHRTFPFVVAHLTDFSPACFAHLFARSPRHRTLSFVVVAPAWTFCQRASHISSSPSSPGVVPPQIRLRWPHPIFGGRS